MIKDKRRFIAVVFVLLGMFLSTVNLVSADPIVANITTDPASPKPLTTFTVIATITGERIRSVNVTISECNEAANQCYIAHANLPMSLNIEGKYETQITLEDDQDRSDHVQYQFVVNDNGTEYTLTNNDWKTFLDLGSSNGQTNGNGDDKSPGFELVFVLIAIIIGVFIYRKKR